MPSQVTARNASTDAQLWKELTTLHTHVENRLATVMQRRHGLGLSEYRALSYLDQAEKSELRMQELADKLALNQSSVTRLVNRLNTAGFTRRDLCPDDKRGAYTVLTEGGRTRYREAHSTYDDTLAAALDEIAAADPAIAAILEAVRSSG